MKTEEVADYWEGNADAWTTMARQGFDICRNHLNAPGFLSILPDVRGLKGLDVGCGEGYNTRLVADLGATLIGVDICEKFLAFARETELADNRSPRIEYKFASTGALPFDAASFDFVMATMSMMDMPNIPQAVSEIFRVIKPGGFFQFSICHPCFQTPMFAWTKDSEGEPIGVVCGNYFQEELEQVHEWTFSSAPEELRNQFGNFKIPTYFKTLSGWLNLLIEHGFVLERFLEPCPGPELIKKFPSLKGLAQVALFLHIRCRKPL